MSYAHEWKMTLLSGNIAGNVVEINHFRKIFYISEKSIFFFICKLVLARRWNIPLWCVFFCQYPLLSTTKKKPNEFLSFISINLPSKCFSSIRKVTSFDRFCKKICKKERMKIESLSLHEGNSSLEINIENFLASPRKISFGSEWFLKIILKNF